MTAIERSMSPEVELSGTEHVWVSANVGAKMIKTAENDNGKANGKRR